MQKRIEKYIKVAEELYLHRVGKGISTDVKFLNRHLDLFIIPVCSMNKSDQDELTLGLTKMISKHESQPKLF